MEKVGRYWLPLFAHLDYHLSLSGYYSMNMPVATEEGVRALISSDDACGVEDTILVPLESCLDHGFVFEEIRRTLLRLDARRPGAPEDPRVLRQTDNLLEWVQSER